MRTHSRSVKTAVGATAVALGVGLSTTLAGSAQAVVNPLATTSVWGLSPDGERLSSFNPGNLSDVRKLGTITGLDGDEKIIGIDVRVQDKKLYGVGDAGGIYTITFKAVATKVSQLSVPLAGTKFGVDFNPAADRLRVVSNTGQNLRHNLGDSMTTTDGPLTYAPAANQPPNPTSTAITGVAYTNNDLSANTTTQLYNLDSSADQLSTQFPANAGTLNAVGKLMLNVNDTVGFDIDSVLKREQTGTNIGYLVLRRTADPKPTMYKVDVTTGSLTKIAGTLPDDVADIAVVLG